MGSPLYFSHPACLEHETTTGRPERPARISAIERSLAERGWLAEGREAASTKAVATTPKPALLLEA
jgi:acetoin utilization deacetylase AcuC-like enzyme